MKGGSHLRWMGALALAVFVASVATAAAGGGSSGGPTKPSRPAFSAPVAGHLKAAGTISARSVPRVHRRHDEDAEVDPPSRALLLRRAGVKRQAPAVPLSGNASTQPGGLGDGQRLFQRAGVRDEGAKQGRGGAAGFVGASMEDLNSFSGATLNNTGCCEPPDTQVAVSSTRVFEPVNLTAFVFDHAGNELGSFDLASTNASANTSTVATRPMGIAITRPRAKSASTAATAAHTHRVALRASRCSLVLRACSSCR